ncbi:hypothetical protein [Halomonas alkalicola]|uniref:RDD family protein n=1 Tax=Halomonas alkalicola TaxID=1930622 RepID=A0ABY9HAX2_9GAMM|nr:hypothetical protein [Halomonas alkalicola]WLI74760.1 hypothetical protein B6N23_07750 [Halomonas alkalicola]
MSLLLTARAPRRGATRRRQPRRGQRLPGGTGLGRWLDRWLDRLVDIAVVVALVVGATALLLTLVTR